MDNTDTQQLDHYMQENNLSKEDVLLIVQRHVNYLQFERDLDEAYNKDEWDDWSEGDMV